MIIPLGTDRPLRRPTLVNHGLVFLTLGIHIACELLRRNDPELWARIHELLALDPRHLTLWSPASYALLHAPGWTHLLGNMVFLWTLGPNVEDRLGRLGYLAFYILGAAAAGLTHALFYANPVIGASGAIAAVTGAYLVLFPHTTVRCFIFFFYIGIFGLPAWWLIGGQIAWNVFITGANAAGNVATLAHLGGYAFGMGVAMLLLATRLLKREPYDLFTLSRHAVRRRQFKEAGYRRDRAAGAQQAQAHARPDPNAEAIMRARAAVTDRIGAGDLPGAGAAYRALLDAHGTAPAAALLSRQTQYDLANALFAAGDHQTAATAYERFLAGYPRDREIPTVRLMLGLLNARYLNDPIRAKAEIGQALPHLPEGEQMDLARELLAELG